MMGLGVGALIAAIAACMGVGRLARDRGRSEIGWPLVAFLASVAGTVAGWLLLAQVLAATPRPAEDFSIWMAALPWVGATVPVAITAAVVTWLPPATSRSRWLVRELGESPHLLSIIKGDALVFGEQRIPLQDILAATTDGEGIALSIANRPRPLVLIPEGSGNRRWRIAQSDAIGRALRHAGCSSRAT